MKFLTDYITKPIYFFGGTAFSTLFAVKYPNSIFLIDERTLPLSYLLEEFMAALPSYVTSANGHATFSPSDDAEPEKIDPYVYYGGHYIKRRVDIDIFEE